MFDLVVLRLVYGSRLRQVGWCLLDVLGLCCNAGLWVLGCYFGVWYMLCCCRLRLFCSVLVLVFAVCELGCCL